MSTIKPCPFCGGRVRFVSDFAFFLSSAVISCEKCNISIFSNEIFTMPDELKEMWNRRVEDETN